MTVPDDPLRSPLPAGRRAELAAHVNQVGQATISDLVERYGVSSDTVRRDLDKLHEEGRLVRTRGGAVSVAVQTQPDHGLSVRLHMQSTEKEIIGELAAALIPDGAILLINAGTTALSVGRALHDHRDLVVATNNLLLPGAMSTQSFREMYVIGGSMKSHTQSTTGPVRFPANNGENVLIRAEFALVAVGAVDVEGGYTTSNLAEAVMMREMMRQSEKVAVLADSSKFDRRLFATVAELGVPDYLVTDAPPPAPLRAALENAGVRIVSPA